MLDRFYDSIDELIKKLGNWLDETIKILPNLVLAILILVITAVAAKYVSKWGKQLGRKFISNKSIINLISNVVTVVFVMVMTFLVLGVLNLDKALTSLLAGAGVIGLAVGLALQDPLINLFSGVLMSVKSYYSVGDIVETNGFFGKIGSITLRNTIIRTTDGQDVIIPNKDVVQNPIMNYSRTPRRRIEVSCGVAYGDDLEEVKSKVLDAFKKNMEFMESQPIEFFYDEFGGSSVNFKVRFWQRITSQADYWAATDKAIILLKKTLDENGFTIPFPIRTLDFGVVGGLRMDEMLPMEKMLNGHPENGLEEING